MGVFMIFWLPTVFYVMIGNNLNSACILRVRKTFETYVLTQFMLYAYAIFTPINSPIILFFDREEAVIFTLTISSLK
jgi:hypothetical protein